MVFQQNDVSFLNCGYADELLDKNILVNNYNLDLFIFTTSIMHCKNHIYLLEQNLTKALSYKNTPRNDALLTFFQIISALIAKNFNTLQNCHDSMETELRFWV